MTLDRILEQDFIRVTEQAAIAAADSVVAAAEVAETSVPATNHAAVAKSVRNVKKIIVGIVLTTSPSMTL